LVPRSDLLEEYRAENIVQRLRVILAELNQFFDYQPQYSSNIPTLTPTRKAKLFFQKVRKKLGI
jgi:hypothetical protein